MMITSTANPRIKFIRKLKDKKHRDESGLFYIEGIRIVSEALEAGWEIDQTIVAPELIKEGYGLDLLDAIKKQNLPILEVSQDVFRSISLKDGPKGMAAVLEKKYSSLDQLLLKKGLWIALDRIQDPGNLGSIMRTADSIGAHGVILLDHCTDPFDIHAIRASMGAFFTVDLIKTSSSDFIHLAKQNHIFTVGTSDHGAVDYQQIDYPDHMVLINGSEREGLSAELMENCDRLVYIPMVGRSDSLNLAIATSIAAYEIYNQHRGLEKK